jgi:hypothetical protein
MNLFDMYLRILIVSAFVLVIFFGEVFNCLFMGAVVDDDLATIAKLGSGVKDFLEKLANVLINFIGVNGCVCPIDKLGEDREDGMGHVGPIFIYLEVLNDPPHESEVCASLLLIYLRWGDKSSSS